MIELYALSDPRDGIVRYIGKAKCARSRLKSHLREARTGRRQTPVYDWIRTLLDLRLAPDLGIIERCAPELWQERETALISEHRASNAKLLNLAKGGDEPFCPIETRRLNGAKAAIARAADPRAYKLWYLKRMLSDSLRRGHVSEATKAKMRARSDVFGGMKNLW